MQYRIVTRISRFISHCMWRADAVLNQFCSLTINHHKLSSGIPTGAAAYYHDVYAAHFNLRCFREQNLHNNAILRSNMKFNEWSKENVKTRTARSRTREEKRLGKTSSSKRLNVN
ncbi:hypothetical protein T03_7780 [Trichinella britovi]|uniref:Uncharacterized protein n=1 Tax=Trichinella britovi TaxID=45882 RepID=A0A0V1D039_TRIBR|nr:hypothetical protein T03_7780 [Trichinella britovi]